MGGRNGFLGSRERVVKETVLQRFFFRLRDTVGRKPLDAKSLKSLPAREYQKFDYTQSARIPFFASCPERLFHYWLDGNMNFDERKVRTGN
jgi:hypothetical protein